MVTWRFTQAQARETAAKPPSTTNTSDRPGRQRRAGRLSCRTQSTLVWCRRGVVLSAGRPSAVSHGNAPTRRDQGTGTKRLMTTHVKPQPWMTCFLVERTASREQPVAVICRPLRRSPVSSAPSPMGAPGGTKLVMSRPQRIRPAWRVDHVARFKTR
jgi:hypothetical protein